MAEFQLGNFRYGLDTRRDVLTSQPGTLVTCENAFINEGGEVIKRKAFVLYASTLAVLDGNGAQGTFGLDSVAEGLVTFGSALAFGSTPTQSQPVLASSTAPVGYMQCQHPSIYNDTGVTYDATYHRMTAVPFSFNFNGDMFVAATFTDGNTFLYCKLYNDSNIGLVPFDFGLIQQSANGKVLNGRTTLADLGDDIARQIEELGWAAFANINQYGAASNGATLIRSPQSDYFSTAPASEDGLVAFRTIAQDGNVARSLGITRSGSTATATAVRHGYIVGDRIKVSGATQTEYNGLFTITAATQDTFAFTVSGTPATPATGTPISVLDGAGERSMASFQITVNSGTFQVLAESPTTLDRESLHGDAIAAGASATATALLLVEAINDFTSYTGYSAVSNGAEVFVYAPPGFTPSLNLRVTYTSGTVLASAGAPTSPVAVITPSPLIVNKTIARRANLQYPVYGDATCNVVSGTAPFTYAWSKLNGDVDLVTGTTTGATARFFARFSTDVEGIPNTGSLSGNFKCVVTDSTGGTPLTFTVFLTVTLNLTVTDG